MSEKYYTIGAPMTDLKRPRHTNSALVFPSVLNPGANNINEYNNFSRERAGLGSAPSVRFHDCSLNESLTNLRDLRDHSIGSHVKGKVYSAGIKICDYLYQLVNDKSC